MSRAILWAVVALSVAAGSVAANANQLDQLYARVLREPANTELNLSFARLAEERGVLRWALMAYERVVLNDPNNWDAKVGLMRVRRALQPDYTLMTVEFGTGYESNPLYYLPNNQAPFTAPGDGKGRGAWLGQGLVAFHDERKVAGQTWRTNAAIFGQANSRYGDLNYAHAGGETGPVYDLLPGLSFAPAIGGAAAYFHDRFYYGEGSASATFEGTADGIYRALRLRAAYRSYDDYFPSQEGWYYEIRGRVAVPKLFGEGSLVALSPWVLWSDISGTVTNALVTEIQPGAYREVGGRVELFQQVTAWMTVGASLSASWRDYSHDYVTGTANGERRRDTLLIPGAVVLFPGFFWKEWDLRFDYRYLQNDSNDPTKEFHDHIITAAVTKRFDPFRAAPAPGR